jgi:hypothetical protein
MALRFGLEITSLDAAFLGLDIKSQSGEVIKPEICKAFIQQAIVEKKKQEIDSLTQKLGLPND